MQEQIKVVALGAGGLVNTIMRTTPHCGCSAAACVQRQMCLSPGNGKSERRINIQLWGSGRMEKYDSVARSLFRGASIVLIAIEPDENVLETCEHYYSTVMRQCDGEQLKLVVLFCGEPDDRIKSFCEKTNLDLVALTAQELADPKMSYLHGYVAAAVQARGLAVDDFSLLQQKKQFHCKCMD